MPGDDMPASPTPRLRGDPFDHNEVWERGDQCHPSSPTNVIFETKVFFHTDTCVSFHNGNRHR